MDRVETLAHKELTDEEWCELCFRIMEMDEARHAMARTIFAEERPTLDELWFVMSSYQRETDKLFRYVGERLRAKARQAA
jgi:hypothetical protein